MGEMIEGENKIEENGGLPTAGKSNYSTGKKLTGHVIPGS